MSTTDLLIQPVPIKAEYGGAVNIYKDFLKLNKSNSKF